MEINCYSSIKKNIEYLNKELSVDINFDILSHAIKIGNREACYYFIDGLCKDDIIQKLNQFFIEIKEEDMPSDVKGFMKEQIPYCEVDSSMKWEDIKIQLLSGVLALFIDGYNECILIDARTYPARDVSEPDKEKALRGSKDCFVETIVFNTALLRRRIRDKNLLIEMKQVGSSSKTDVAVCYMNNKVNKQFLSKLISKIESINVEALTVNQESLAECIYSRKWFNPFPKFRFTERPDIATAQIMEGSIIVFTDNSPFALIFPISLFDILEEADDYYFPPITGTYLRLARFLIVFSSYFIPPTFLLLMMYPDSIPDAFNFIKVSESINIPLIFQFLILEIAIDGLKLAAVNTPNMLSTPLSVMAALILGEFSVKSGWFNAEVMLYMAFVALANYTLSNYEFGYAVKFMRILNLILTAIFGTIGFIFGIIVFILFLLFNRTPSGNPYLSPLIPFKGKELCNRLFRKQL